MVQQFRTFVTLIEDLGLVSNTHMEANNHVLLQLQGI